MPHVIHIDFDSPLLVLSLLYKLDGLPPEQTDLNLGAIAEDSINMDPEGFVKDLQARAGPTSDFATIVADDIAVETFVVPDGADLSGIAPATRNPTRAVVVRVHWNASWKRSTNSIVVNRCRRCNGSKLK